jgi:hypothetical protein
MSDGRETIHERLGSARHVGQAPGVVSESVKWEVVRPSVLDGEPIVIVYDENYLQDAYEAAAGRVVYTHSEVSELERCGFSDAALKKVHRVKKAFDGTIVPWDSPLGRRLRRKGLWE